MELNEAIKTFEKVDANLKKMEQLWSDIKAEYPDGVSLNYNPPGLTLKIRQYKELLESIPLIKEFRPTSVPSSVEEVGQLRVEGLEIGDYCATLSIERDINKPEEELAEYRFSFDKQRKTLIRKELENVVAEFDSVLQLLSREYDFQSAPDLPVSHEAWAKIPELLSKIALLFGKEFPRRCRWNDLQRHLKFGLNHDLLDIINLDWPNIKSVLSKEVFDEFEPIPVESVDLADIVASKPQGKVVTKLNWVKLTADDFERLIYSLITNETNYENPKWLMKVNSTDRGRDLSAEKIVYDPLSGTLRLRVIFQCKHWLSKSIALDEISALIAQMKLWEPPRVDELVIVTSGRFTTDGVQFVEKHNQEDHGLRITLWAESHLETLLAARPYLIASAGLR